MMQKHDFILMSARALINYLNEPELNETFTYSNIKIPIEKYKIPLFKFDAVEKEVLKRLKVWITPNKEYAIEITDIEPVTKIPYTYSYQN